MHSRANYRRDYKRLMKKHPFKIAHGDASNNSGRRPGQEANQGIVIVTDLIAEKSKPKSKKPPLYKVLLLNDDYTPMDFVVVLLMRFFSMSQEQAERVMIHAHTKGMGVCGVFPKEVAETKVCIVRDFVSENQHPLQCTTEKN